MKKLTALLLVLLALNSYAQKIPKAPFSTTFDLSNGAESPDYYNIIKWWTNLDAVTNKIQMRTMGPTDAGFPLHLVVVSHDGDFDMASLRRKNKRIILINNGIHPGEPDGIDASMLLVRDIVLNKAKLPDNVVLAIIPVYNIGGCLNRSAFYRIDQDGPNEFGSRGNSQNLDLNRDFIKSDSKEARSFAEIFHLCDPDVFVDNHVSNGADYQHVMTLIASQHSKLGGKMGAYMNGVFEPALYASMKEKGYDLIPYVNSFGDTPASGWPEFLEGPRYSSGYASLWHTFAFVPETHMLKPYPQRVKATYDLMVSFIDFTSKNSEDIRKARDEQKRVVKTNPVFPIGWTVNRNKFSQRFYRGYESGRKPSEISGLPRLYYDRTKPYDTMVKFFNFYEPKMHIEKPEAYIIPQGWWKVIDLLKINKVQMRQLGRDTTIEVQVYRIDDYKTAPRPNEMHHINSDVKVSTTMKQMKFRKGDYYIPMNQVANRFILEVLEPQSDDSYFAWNFFDGILGQKEGYSAYVFEDKAVEMLKANPDLKARLEQRRATDTAFAKSASQQLGFVFQNSPYMEPDYLRYPVYRVVK